MRPDSDNLGSLIAEEAHLRIRLRCDIANDNAGAVTIRLQNVFRKYTIERGECGNFTYVAKRINTRYP